MSESVTPQPDTLSLDQLSAVAAPILRKYGVRSAAVFGSMARGEAGPDSDVDLLVEFGPDATLLTLTSLQIELAEALSRQVDVVTPRSLKPLIRPHVLNGAKSIYG